MSARSLHNAMRDRVRRELRSSPILWKEYVRRRWAARKARAPLIASGPIAVLGYMFMSGLPGIFLAGMLHDDAARAGPAALPPSPLWSLACLSVAQAGASVFFAGHLMDLIWRSSDVTKMSYFPVTDRRYFRWQLGRFYRDSAAIVIPSAVVLAALATRHATTTATWAAVGLFSLVAWLTVAASAILIAANYRKPIITEVAFLIGMSLIIVSVFGAMAGGRLAAIDTAVARLTFVICPTGWLNAAFYYGVIRGAPFTWLFVIPVAAMTVFAARWSLSSFRVREMECIDQKPTITAIDSDVGLATIDSWTRPRRNLAKLAPREEAMDHRERPIPVKADNDFLRPFDWSRLGWVERFVAARLTERQRLLLEFSSLGNPHWTAGWLFTLVPAALTCVVLWALDAKGERAGEMLAAILTWMTIGASVVDGRKASSRRQGALSQGPEAPLRRPLDAYFPICFRELTKVGFVRAAWQAALGLPIVFGFNLLGTILGGRSALEAVVRVVAGYMIVFAWRFVGCCLSVSSSTNDTANQFIRVGWFAMILLLGSLSVICFLPLGMYTLVSAAAALIIAWAGWRKYAWLLDHGDIDIVR